MGGVYFQLKNGGLIHGYIFCDYAGLSKIDDAG